VNGRLFERRNRRFDVEEFCENRIGGADHEGWSAALLCFALNQWASDYHMPRNDDRGILLYPRKKLCGYLFQGDERMPWAKRFTC